MIKTFLKGGIHPPENKFTSNSTIQEISLPQEFRIILSQSIGAPSKAIVKTGDKIKVGEKIAEAAGYVSADLHSPVNGTIGKIEEVSTPQGFKQQSIQIIPDSENPYKFEVRERTFEEVEALSDV